VRLRAAMHPTWCMAECGFKKIPDQDVVKVVVFFYNGF